MECLRCGKETENDRNFCGECMAQMEKYPVKPGTPVQLPLRGAQTHTFMERPKKRSVPTEKEQIAKLYRKNQVLTVLLMLTMIACLAVSGLCVRLFYRQPARPTGQNYSTSVQETAP